MTIFDFSPLLRSTVGFDHMMHALDSASRLEDASASYPPYDIEADGEDGYRVTIAVAGFGKDDLEVETRDNVLRITGRPAEDKGPETYLHRGIPGGPFQRTFQLADNVRVTGAYLDNGLLRIDLVHEVPEAMKPRKIEISGAGNGKSGSKVKRLVEGTVGRAA